jgi:hypothetical protein
MYKGEEIGKIVCYVERETFYPAFKGNYDCPPDPIEDKVTISEVFVTEIWGQHGNRLLNIEKYLNEKLIKEKYKL